MVDRRLMDEATAGLQGALAERAGIEASPPDVRDVNQQPLEQLRQATVQQQAPPQTEQRGQPQQPEQTQPPVQQQAAPPAPGRFGNSSYQAPQREDTTRRELEELRKSVSGLLEYQTAVAQTEFQSKFEQLPPHEQAFVRSEMEKAEMAQRLEEVQQSHAMSQQQQEALARAYSIKLLSTQYGVPENELNQFNDPQQMMGYAAYQAQQRQERINANRQARAQAPQQSAPAPNAAPQYVAPYQQGQRQATQQVVQQVQQQRYGGQPVQRHAGQHQFESGGAPSQQAPVEGPKTFQDAERALRNASLPVL